MLQSILCLLTMPMKRLRPLTAAMALAATPSTALDLAKPPDSLRIALFNASLSREGAGKLIFDIEKGTDKQPLRVAEIILRTGPDILILNEFDYDPLHRGLTSFAGVLARGISDLPGIEYPYRFHPAVNTGVPSDHDLDRDGVIAGPGDAFGFGRFPGQYGMAVLSRYPLSPAQTYRLFRWRDLPGARRPRNPDGSAFYTDAAWEDFRLSSKSHFNLPVMLPDGRALHLLVAHPTPPVFDGPENANGLRNGDEIRLLTSLIDAPSWLKDDAGIPAVKPEHFVVAGDLNADPVDGEGDHIAMDNLLGHPRVQDPRPTSPGALEAADQGGANASHLSDAAQDTADWRDKPGPGNLRVDYLLGSENLNILKSGVFWPPRKDPLEPLVRMGRNPASSDHRLVWIDIATP
ncbi:MAG: endonuclease/exonuclease/phosphatase family protein [Pseudomonadota bacterium]